MFTVKLFFRGLLVFSGLVVKKFTALILLMVKMVKKTNKQTKVIREFYLETEYY